MKISLRPWAAAVAMLLIASAAPAGTSRPKPPSAAWLQPVPAARRAPLLDAMKKLVNALKQKDWSTVYALRPLLDRETEDEARFIQRWAQESPGHIVDFEPKQTTFAEFGGLSEDDQVFDIMGCARVEKGDKPIAQEGGITAHYDGDRWYLDGVHLMTTDTGEPEPCESHPSHGLLAGDTQHR